MAAAGSWMNAWRELPKLYKKYWPRHFSTIGDEKLCHNMQISRFLSKIIRFTVDAPLKHDSWNYRYQWIELSEIYAKGASVEIRWNRRRCLIIIVLLQLTVYNCWYYRYQSQDVAWCHSSSQYRIAFSPLSLSLWNDLFDGVGQGGFRAPKLFSWPKQLIPVVSSTVYPFFLHIWNNLKKNTRHDTGYKTGLDWGLRLFRQIGCSRCHVTTLTSMCHRKYNYQ